MPQSHAHLYAERLLRSLGMPAPALLNAPTESPALAWADSGLMALTGRADGAPQMCPAPLASCADGTLATLASIAPTGAFADLKGRDLLSERAAAFGHNRNGAISPGGSCRLLPTADGMLALNLAREDDWALLPAWLETDVAPDWEAVRNAVRTQPVETLVMRARELGLAAANAKPDVTAKSQWMIPLPLREGPGEGKKNKQPLVIDLSTLWAGPLCGHLLQKAGAEVIKLESLQRPDGARRGPPALFDLLNVGKRSVTLDLSTAQGRTQLHSLLGQADIVIESSRPRALRQMGIHAEELLREKPGLCWIAISGYGRDAPQENWIAYGDDASIAAGLSQQMHQATGEWLICGDAIADPLTGLHAALAAWAHWQAGQGGLISLALRDVVRHCMESLDDGVSAARRAQAWRQEVEAAKAPIRDPRLRKPASAAEPLGASNAALFARLGIAG